MHQQDQKVWKNSSEQKRRIGHAAKMLSMLHTIKLAVHWQKIERAADFQLSQLSLQAVLF